MKKVAVLLAPGFEEAEAIVTLDILRRLHIDVETLACAESRAVVSYHDIPMVADSTLSERQQALFDALVLLKGRRYVCSGDLWKAVPEGVYVDAPVVEDGNLISGKGLGHVFDFALTLSARLLGDDAPVREQAEHIYYPW